MSKRTLNDDIKGFSELLDATENELEKIKYLHQVAGDNNDTPIMILFDMAFNPDVEFDLPKGDEWLEDVKFYRSAENENFLRSWLMKHKHIYLMKGAPFPKLTDKWKQSNFKNLLEQVHPDDARLMIAIYKKNWPYNGVTYDLLSRAFPNIWPARIIVSTEDVEPGDDIIVESSVAVDEEEVKPAPKPKTTTKRTTAKK